MANLAMTTDQVKALLDRIERGDSPDRARLEETLTDGYALALNLDAECRRLERRISANAEQLAEEASEERARELSCLARMLRRRRQELDSLRALLAGLRSGVRPASAA
jgi:hypothetical protein